MKPIGMFAIRNFDYNGMFIYLEDGEAPYRADFLRWTTDPGVALFKCSDGEKRLIPSICIMGIGRKFLPPPPPPPKELNCGIIHMGMPSRS